VACRSTIDEVNDGRDVPIVVRQAKDLNNIAGSSRHKRVTRPRLNFRSFRPPSSVLAGIGLMHMIRKGQFKIDDAEAMSFADQFSAMAGVIRPV
jgi:putative transposase